jgi:hypothetical protein
MTCPLCRQRKAKRLCPGKGYEICTVCCGTKRNVEIECPPTCVYLESSVRHPAAAVKRQQEHDLILLMSALGRVTEPQLQLFFLIQSFILRFDEGTPDAPSHLLVGATSGARLTDADVADAAGALAESFETAARGVVYEPQAEAVRGEGLRRELKAFLSEIGRGGGARFERGAAEVLRGVERGARHVPPGLEGPTAYLDLAGRILQERGPQPQSRSPLILP